MTESPSESRPFYLSTAIPFVNANPHVGFAFEAILADALARYQRLRGDEVHFQSGTDDNSLKNVRAAEREGVAPGQLVARYAERFRSLAATLDLSYDEFIQTSVDPRHRPGVEALWQACLRSGDLYRRPYQGLYCVGCEQFFAPAELADGRCPEHGIPPEPVEEENWFFRLSRYGDRIASLIAGGHLRIAPESRRNEVLSFLSQGLADISVSRSRSRARGWGIPVPGDPEQVIYVWFDALANYITTLGWTGDGPAFRRWWAGHGRRAHVIGKGIVRFHAVYWPAILLSAGLPLPTDLVVHGYLTVEGQKIGKSLGNAIDPEALVQRHGTDAVRYFLLRHLRPFEDGDFSEARLRACRDADLADQLGNLLRRTITLVARCFDGKPPTAGASAAPDETLRADLQSLPGRLQQILDRFASDEALAAIFDSVATTNRYFDQTAPWKLARLTAHPQEGAGARDRLQTVLHNTLEALRIVAVALAPFLPATSKAICAQLGHDPPGLAGWSALRWGSVPWRRDLPGGPVLFPKTAAGDTSSPRRDSGKVSP
jgi:methionyl-tRNA synthetase